MPLLLLQQLRVLIYPSQEWLPWIPPRVLADKYFPAELPGGLRGATATWDNPQLHHQTHDPITAQSPHVRHRTPSLVHSCAQLECVCSGGQGLLVTLPCQPPQPHLFFIGSSGSQGAPALRAQLQVCSFPGKVFQCLKKKKNPNVFLWGKAVNSQIQPAAGSGPPNTMQLVGPVLHHQNNLFVHLNT